MLQSTGLDWPTLREILVGFFHDNQDTAKAIRLAQEGNDGEALLRLAHSLKGSASNIGARDLQQAASAVERACIEHASADSIVDLIGGLEKELERVLGLLESLAEREEEVGDEDLSSGTAGDLEALLTTLADAIDRADPEEIRRGYCRDQEGSLPVGRLSSHQSSRPWKCRRVDMTMTRRCRQFNRSGKLWRDTHERTSTARPYC